MIRSMNCPFCHKRFPVELRMVIPESFTTEPDPHPFTKKQVERILGVKITKTKVS